MHRDKTNTSGNIGNYNSMQFIFFFNLRGDQYRNRLLREVMGSLSTEILKMLLDTALNNLL